MYRNRAQRLYVLLTLKDDLCFCNDIAELSERLEIPYNDTNWRLFIDASNESIKAVLLYNVNTLLFVPITHSATMKNSNKNAKTILASRQYNDHKWHICADFKVVAMLTSLNFAASCVCGTLEQELNIMYASIGPLEMKLSNENLTSSITHF